MDKLEERVLSHAVHAYKVACVARMAMQTASDGTPTIACLEASIVEGVRAALLAAFPHIVPPQWHDPTGFSVDMVKDEATNWTRRETGKQMLLNYAAMMEAQEVARG